MVIAKPAPAINPLLVFATKGQVAGIGDLDGDGFDDILVGSAATQINFAGGSSLSSEAYIFYGRKDFPALVNVADVPPELGTRIVAAQGGFNHTGFGRNVAAAGDMNLDGIPDFLIGAYLASVRGHNAAGEAYLIYGRRDFGSLLDLRQPFDGVRVVGSRSNDALGSVVSPAGDVNADGAPDFLVGATINSSVGTRGHHGGVYLVYGTRGGDAPLTLTGITPEDGTVRGGTSVILRGSGFTADAEVLFGPRSAGVVTVVTSSELRVVTPPATQPGEVDVSVRVGGVSRTIANGFVYTPALPVLDLARPGRHGLRLEGNTEHRIGLSLAFGDFNGDGTDDLAVGSGAPGGWIISLVPGGPGLPEVVPLFESTSDYPRITPRDIGGEESTEGQVAAVGDVNGDGIVDLGFSFAAERLTGYVLFGGPVLERQALTLEEELENGSGFRIVPDALRDTTYLRMSLARLGDVTGDGIDDLVVAVSLAEQDPGRVFFLLGRRDWPAEVDLSSDAGVFARIDSFSPWFANRIANVGDVDGDAHDDLLVSRFSTDCYVIYSRPDLRASADINELVANGGATQLLRRDREREGFFEVSGAGDFNGDGYADLLIGDHRGGENWRGVTFLVPGGPDLPSRVDLPSVPDAPDGILRVFGPGDLANSGMEIGPAGDLNADGYDDFYVGSLDPFDPFAPVGFFVILGGEDTTEPIELSRPRGRGFLLRGVTAPVYPAGRIRETGDLNGDGYQDFAFSEFPIPPPLGSSLSPGAVSVVFGLPRDVSFVRGDANFDGAPNVTDAVFVLSYLFGGGAAPSCLDAADTDDSGALNLSDGVYLLEHLFNGGPPPPAPFPEEGRDLTEDGLDCRAF